MYESCGTAHISCVAQGCFMAVCSLSACHGIRMATQPVYTGSRDIGRSGPGTSPHTPPSRAAAQHATLARQRLPGAHRKGGPHLGTVGGFAPALHQLHHAKGTRERGAGRKSRQLMGGHEPVVLPRPAHTAGARQAPAEQSSVTASQRSGTLAGLPPLTVCCLFMSCPTMQLPGWCGDQ